MFQKVLEKARQRKIHRIFLWVLVKNTIAQAFFKKTAFAPKERPIWYRGQTSGKSNLNDSYNKKPWLL